MLDIIHIKSDKSTRTIDWQVYNIAKKKQMRSKLMERDILCTLMKDLALLLILPKLVYIQCPTPSKCQ